MPEPDMNETILDRVLSSKRTQQMEGFNPGETVLTLLKELTEREADVLRRRFGLTGKPPETLEEIGRQYRVTRERIRQIQNTAIQRVRALKHYGELIEPVGTAIVETLNAHGGIMSEQALLKELFQLSNDTPTNRQSVIFLMAELLRDKVARLDDRPSYRPAWRLLTASITLLDGTIETLERAMKEAEKPLRRTELLERFRHQPFFQSHAHQITDEMILSSLDVSQTLAQNPFGEFGLVEWGAIVPRRINDKISLVLKREGKPLHFQEITKRINESRFDDRPAYAPTVHNELILNEAYVLVGRGIYALREWGYKPGVVADIIAETLRERGEPMERQALVDAVLKQRLVKRNTIHLALTDRKRFQRLPDGRYALANGQLPAGDRSAA